MKISDLTGDEYTYWAKVANDYAAKYGMKVDDFRAYDKNNSITFNSYNKSTNVFSNFYPCKLQYNGINFHSAEQLFFYLCTTTKPDLQRLIMQQPNALAVKKLHIPDENLNADFEQTRIQIMRTVLQVKYNYCAEYRKALQESGDKDLIEYAFWWDLFWGATTNKTGKYYVGINAVGRLHMELRKNNR